MSKCICKNCGKSFITSRQKAKVCSSSCRSKLFRKERGLVSPNLTVNCQICEKTFNTKNPNQKNCSKACLYEAMKNYTKRHREKNKL